MGMITKIYDNISYYIQERDDPVAGKLRRLADWCHVSKGSISGWMPRPQRFVGSSSENTATDGVIGDNMVDITWDNLSVWDDKFGIDDSGTRIHLLNEMPVAFSRTKLGSK